MSLLVVFIFALIFLFYVYRKFYCHRVFRRLGIPGPEPHWLYGNTLQLYREDRHLVVANWSAQYGDFYGIYYGSWPILAVSTPEAVEEICVKQYSNFQGHLFLPVQPNPDKAANNPLSHIVFVRGEKWKRYRTICNPAFSSAKLKAYSSFLSRSQKHLMDLFSDRAKSGEPFDIREGFQFLTLDTIGEVGFGLQFDAIRNHGKGNFILEKLRAHLKNAAAPPPIMMAALVLTELRPFFEFLVNVQVKNSIGFFGPASCILRAVKEMIKKRREPNSRRNDILQMMVDVSADNDHATRKDDTAAAAVPASMKMTDDEIAANGLVFFVAGYETTSTTLGFASHLLATNQNVQDKLAKEISARFPLQVDGSFPEIDYETAMNKIPYLDWVCQETLRLYPVGMNLLSRFVMNETTVFGVNVPMSVRAVLIDNWTIHNSERLWGPVDTSEFYPERFSPEQSESRPESAFLGFGFGPRICLGKRLALLQMKVTLINLLLRFRIVRPDGGHSGDSLCMSSKSVTLFPLKGVPVKLVPRV